MCVCVWQQQWLKALFKYLHWIENLIRFLVSRMQFDGIYHTHHDHGGVEIVQGTVLKKTGGPALVHRTRLND